MSSGYFAESGIVENRNLAPQPQFEQIKSVDQYLKSITTWFNDHYGFRGYLIRFKNQIDFSIFGISSKIHIGNDGWLFYKDIVDEGKHSVDLQLKAESDDFIEGIEFIGKTLKEKGITLVVVIPPMKDTIYGEFLPATANRLTHPSQFDLLESKLNKAKNFIFIDTTSMLKEISRIRPVFHKTDFHWNDPAAFEIAREIVTKIDRLEGITDPTWKHNLTIKTEIFSGGEAKFMPLFPSTPAEEGLFLIKTFKDVPHLYRTQPPLYEFIIEMNPPKSGQLSPVFIYGDSFADGFIRSGIYTYFKKTYRVRFSDISINDLLLNLPPDVKYLILECIETKNDFYTQVSKIKNNLKNQSN